MRAVRTFSRDQWQEAQALWTEGEFSDEWRRFRHEAAMAGILYPPSGSRWDSWEDDSPSQRAILIRAIRETPELLSECIRRSSSWHGVIERLTRRRDQWREEQRLAEREPEDIGPSPVEAMQVIGELFSRYADSVAGTRREHP